MKTTVIDVTGLSDKQIALVEEIVTALRSVPDNQQINQGGNDDVTVTPEDDELRQLHEEFSWLIANIGKIASAAATSTDSELTVFPAAFKAADSKIRNFQILSARTEHLLSSSSTLTPIRTSNPGPSKAPIV